MPTPNRNRKRAEPGWRATAQRPVSLYEGHPRLRCDARAVVDIIHLLDANAAEIVGRTAASVPPGELSLAILTDPALARLHATFLDDPAATDVITFSAAPSLGQAGEICVSADRARRFASSHGLDFQEELTLYLVHGWLHLAGHDDLDPASKRRMRAAEARAMACLRSARAIPRFSFS